MDLKKVGQVQYGVGSYRGPLQVVHGYVIRFVFAGEPTVFIYGVVAGQQVLVNEEPYLPVEVVFDHEERMRGSQLVAQHMGVDLSYVVWANND